MLAGPVRAKYAICPMTRDSVLYDWTHGWHGLVTVYVLVAVSQLAGQWRGRADIGAYVIWPLTSFVTMAVATITETFLLWLLEKFASLDAHGSTEPGVAVFLFVVGGFVGGLYWAKRNGPMLPLQNRGAQVTDGTMQQWATKKRRAKAASFSTMR